MILTCLTALTCRLISSNFGQADTGSDNAYMGLLATLLIGLVGARRRPRACAVRRRRKCLGENERSKVLIGPVAAMGRDHVEVAVHTRGGEGEVDAAVGVEVGEAPLTLRLYLGWAARELLVSHTADNDTYLDLHGGINGLDLWLLVSAAKVAGDVLGYIRQLRELRESWQSWQRRH